MTDKFSEMSGASNPVGPSTAAAFLASTATTSAVHATASPDPHLWASIRRIHDSLGSTPSDTPQIGRDQPASDASQPPSAPPEDSQQIHSPESARYQLLRHYSLIIPETGERVRRQVTLDPFTGISDASGRQALISNDEEEDLFDTGEDTALLMGEQPRLRPRRSKFCRLTKWVRIKQSACYDQVVQMVQSVSWIAWIYKHLLFGQFTEPLKCALTYFIASFAVFSPTMSQLLGSSDGKHLTATVTVYFHPSRTVGSMIEATAFAQISFIYSTVLSICSMLTAAAFRKINHLDIGLGIVLVVYCAGGLGSIAFMKHKVGKQTFNPACSLASTALTRILVREGSVQQGRVSMGKIWQVWSIVNLGVLISATVCLLVFPVTAVGKLRKTSNKLMDMYANMLSIVTRSFLAGTDVTKTEVEEVFNAARGLIVSLDSILQEAKYEYYVTGTETEYFFQARLTKSIQSLMQHLGGLRSSLIMEWNLINKREDETRSHCGELFDIFVYYLGPPMKSLTFTVKSILEALPYDDNTGEILINDQFAQSLNAAVELFSAARLKGLQEIYSQDVFRSQASREELAIHLEKVASTCGQFARGLEDLAKEIRDILDILNEYDDYLVKGRPKSWWWILFVMKNPRNEWDVNTDLDSDEVIVPSTLAFLFNEESGKAKTKYDDETSGIQAPWTLRLWRGLHLFRRSDVRFGVKVGLGAMVFALPAFVSVTRPIFTHYRGEWGLVTFVLMMNISIGGTTNTIFYRLFGTCIGCYSAVLIWFFFPSDPVILSLTGLFIAIPCFAIMIGWKSNSSFGRFILLAFNLTALYSYNVSQNDLERDDGGDDEGGVNPIVSEIAIHRLIAVSCGVLWSIFITMYIWPNSARATLKRKLSILWIRMGLIWKSDPLNSLVYRGEQPKPYITIQEEQRLQKSLLRMGSLVSAASNEFRLKGPFPAKSYQNIMKMTQSILDSYHNMNSMIMYDLHASERESEIIRRTVEERKELTSRLFLLFYLLASALRLGLPIPDHLPNTVHARDSMIIKINEYRMKQINVDQGTDDDFVLFYAYILATISINDGLLQIIETLQDVYGTIEEESLSV
ncbi:Fusaric acid resistance protein-like-domain-containing protein [Limtongia smithiae]|uniref:Fusaric acid resistance protein-like-domain-containing protein n=1 Tax=Limtongia smithiae TaxID=1125753 RepID=UPI0034CF2F2B